MLIYCLNSKYGVDKTISLLKFKELVVTDLLGERLNEIVPRITNNSFHYSLVPNRRGAWNKRGGGLEISLKLNKQGGWNKRGGGWKITYTSK